MRRVVVTLASFGALLVQPAAAQLHCLSPQEHAAVEVAALRSELMVLATGCHNDDQYNAFIQRFRADLIANEKAVDDIFKRRYGKRGQQEHDRFTTELANGESDAGMRLGSEFCPRNSLLFKEVMALRDASELQPYAAAKDLVPATTNMCPTAAAAPAKPAPRAKQH